MELGSGVLLFAKSFLLSVFNYTVFSDKAIVFTRINILRGKGQEKTRRSGFNRVFD